MNMQRVDSLKRILDNVLMKSLIYVSAAVNRVRGLKKWINANGLISDCIRPQEKFKSKQSTCITNLRGG